MREDVKEILLDALLPRPASLPVAVRDRSGTVEGVVTGRTWRCRLEGCRGVRVEVKWPDGTVTRPCSAGMREVEPGVWQIV